MSWWKRIFSRSENSTTEPHSASGLPIEDLNDELLIEVRNLVAISGPKTPDELARLLKIGHARASFLSAAANAQHPQASRARTFKALQPSATAPKPPAEPVAAEPKKRRAKKASPVKAALPPLTGRITGGHTCAFDVVGESHYQPALRKLRNGRHMATDNDFVADIVAEPDNPHDPNACAVYIEGLKVGYLPRDAAADFHQQIADMSISGTWRFQTKAKLSGGWGDRPMVGVLLSLPNS
ncbi:HIRAN domain-containing protein [Pseudomonas fluorescens]|uniref:HIRAN domain-containing protein n=1 Tax=Pseudomonas fluorescens TaxID=294 RepID=UPI0012FDA38D|nr:HIRAN domain-containing protein [Pseudomonas fluorescens]